MGHVDANELLTTGKFAEINSISRKTLRIWHDLGLLRPCKTDPSNGYSYYSLEQCSTVDAITHLQQCGISLAQIKELMDRDYDGLLQVLLEKKEEVDKQIIELTVSRQNIDRLLESYRWWDSNPIFDVPIVEHLPDQPIIAVPLLYQPASHMGHEIGDFLNNFEINTRLLKQYIKHDDLPMSLFCYIGDHITQENILAGRFDIDQSIIFLNGSLVADKYANATFPGGDYVTMYRDSIDVDGMNTEVQGIEELLRFADDHNLQVNGDYYGQVIGETPIFHFEGRGMAVKLLLPVRARPRGASEDASRVRTKSWTTGGRL